MEVSNGIECGNVRNFVLFFCSGFYPLAVFDMVQKKLALLFNVALPLYPVCQEERAKELVLCHVKSNRSRVLKSSNCMTKRKLGVSRTAVVVSSIIRHSLFVCVLASDILAATEVHVVFRPALHSAC
jgi:hypothetical protein